MGISWDNDGRMMIYPGVIKRGWKIAHQTWLRWFSQRNLPAALSMERGFSSHVWWHQRVNHHYPIIIPWYSHDIPTIFASFVVLLLVKPPKTGLVVEHVTINMWNTGRRAEAKATPISKGPWHWISSAAARNASATLNSWCFWGFVAG